MNLARIVPRIPTASRLDTFRLLTLIRLRWYALFGVCIALVSARMLNFQGLAWAPLALFVLLGSFYNLLLSRATRLPHAVQVQRIYTLQLILDISALAGLLWSSGGLANPFADLFLLHVVVAALIGRFGAVIAAGALASTAAITLHLLEMNDLLIGRWSPPPFLQDTTRLSALLVNAVAIAALVGTLSRRFQAKEARLSEARDAVKLHEQVLDRVLNGLSAAVEVVSGDRIIWQNEAMGAIRALEVGDVWICPGTVHGCNRAIQNADGQCDVKGMLEPLSCLVSVQLSAGPKVFRKYAWQVHSDLQSETVHLYVDETRRITEEEQLRLTERLASLGRLAQGIAHELNTPLSTVRTLTQDVLTVVRGEPGISEEARVDVEDSLSLSLRELDRCARITRGLLGGRGLEGPARPQYQPLTPLIQDAVTLISVGNRRRHQLEIDASEAYAFVDADALLQVLVNLLSNAVDAAPAGTTIEIRCRLNELGTVLEVADRGIGIASSIRARLFEPFATTKPVGQGTGLGLYMVRQLLGEIGGSILLQDREGGGTIARVQLKRTGAEQPATWPDDVPAPFMA